MTRLLLRNLLGLFFLLAQKVGQPGEGLARDDQTAGDQSLASSDVSITTALLVFIGIGVKSVVLAGADETQGKESEVKDAGLYLLGIFLHNWELLVDPAEGSIG